MEKERKEHGVLWVVAGLILAAAFWLFLFSRFQSSSPEQETSLHAGDEADFTDPIYETGESDEYLARPLYLERDASGVITRAQREFIEAYKQKVLERVAREMPLREDEKGVLATSISTTTKPDLGSLFVADQTVLRFSDAELRTIVKALER